MDKILSFYYILVGFLCIGGIFASFFLGQYVLASWLFLAVFINYFLYQAVRKTEKHTNNGIFG